MIGDIVDLSDPHAAIPNPVVVDTNVVVAFMQASYLNAPTQAARAAPFFRRLVSANHQAIVTPTVFSEFVHIAIKFRYTTAIKAEGKASLTHRLGVPINSWQALLKHDASILQGAAEDLAELRRSLVAYNVSIVDPEQLGRIDSGRTHHEELLHVVTHYGLDTSDALILMEASRLGVRSIVTMDGDMLRARADFDIFTWR